MMDLRSFDRIGMPLAFLAFLFIPSTLLAQNEEDALRMSTLMPGGTARSAGLANAYGALGADGASIAINPAGMGVYRSSELSFTPSIEVNDATSLHYGTSNADTQTRFYFSNLVLAINNPARNEGDWRSSTYGIAFDRQQSHHYRYFATGRNVPSSLLHQFHDEALSVPNPDLANDFPFTSSLAWETYGLDIDPATNELAPAIAFGNLTDQEHVMETRGATSNTAFFYSGNYKDKLYIGASIGIVGHRFRRLTTHSETNLSPDSNNVVYSLRDLTYKETVNTTGNGFDAKIGVIGRITERFRMGLAFHSPQWLQLNDAYVMEMTTDFLHLNDTIPTAFGATSPDGVFNYRLVTPWRLVWSAAYIAGPNGLFSVDYEFADMSRMRFRPSSRIDDEYDFRVENDIISNVFQPMHSVRAGTEWRTGAWYFRLGWGYSTDAYKSTDPRHGSAFRNYAGGIGYRTDHVGVDLGINYSERSTRYLQYNDRYIDPTIADLRNYRVMATVSFRP